MPSDGSVYIRFGSSNSNIGFLFKITLQTKKVLAVCLPKIFQNVKGF